MSSGRQCLKIPLCPRKSSFSDDVAFSSDLKYGSTLAQLHSVKPRLSAQSLYPPGTPRVTSVPVMSEEPPMASPDTSISLYSPRAGSPTDQRSTTAAPALAKSMLIKGTREDQVSLTAPLSITNTLTVGSSDKREARTHPDVPPAYKIVRGLISPDLFNHSKTTPAACIYLRQLYSRRLFRRHPVHIFPGRGL